jgi:hypothetical protein
MPHLKCEIAWEDKTVCADVERYAGAFSNVFGSYILRTKWKFL